MPHALISLLNIVVLSLGSLTFMPAIGVAETNSIHGEPASIVPSITAHWTPPQQVGIPGRREGGGTR